MNLCQVNPHLRFASDIHYNDPLNRVKVTDCRIFYISAGRAELSIGSQTFTLQPGTLFYCSAGSVYTIKVLNSIQLISFNFDLTQAHNDLLIPIFPCKSPEQWDAMPVHYDPVEDSPFLSTYFHLPQGQGLLPLVKKLLSEFSSLQPFYRENCSCILKQLLIAMHRTAYSSLPPKIATVKQYIDTNYQKPITNQTLAEMVGYHPYYLNRSFSLSTGMTLHQYLQSVRLTQAAHLILNTDIPLKAIPELTGFAGYPHFSSCFHSFFGYSPAQYRSLLKKTI